MDLLQQYTFPTLAHTFLNLMRDSQAEKRVLDCGAGGERLPTALFSYYGYETHGIDIDKARLATAQQFCDAVGVQVTFQEGDIRDLPYQDGSFGRVFCYNTICHLSKHDTAKVTDEMLRVL